MEVLFHDDFAPEFRALEERVQDAFRAYAKLLTIEGPHLGRPYADTLKGSAHANMKELRPTVDKVEWRVAFAFDVERQAILLAAVAKGPQEPRLQRPDQNGGPTVHGLSEEIAGDASGPPTIGGYHACDPG